MTTHQGLTTRSGAERRAQLAARLKTGELLVAPGVYEGISARMADGMGFEALYMTG
jgi:2-methylisocitrate lyase-like PEP mutase family enzyme